MQYPIGHLIEFAVYGQQLVREGTPVRMESIIREFGDVRHVFALPNLNPPTSFPEADSLGIGEYKEKPRNLFSEPKRDDVWLGEAALIQGDHNLKVAALNQAIQLDVSRLGGPYRWVEIVQQSGRTYQQQRGEAIEPGQWRWVTEGRQRWLEIFFRRNQYPCTLIGVKTPRIGDATEGDLRTTESIFFVAHGHKYGWQGCTIEEAADFLKNQGATDILMFDEGNDVFQLLNQRPKDPKDDREPVPLKREQLRCVFWGTATGPDS